MGYPFVAKADSYAPNVFKKGDKVKYLGHEVTVTNVNADGTLGLQESDSPGVDTEGEVIPARWFDGISTDALDK